VNVAPAGIETSPPHAMYCGRESITCTLLTSLPGMGPLPNTLRQVYPSHSSTSMFVILVAVVWHACLFTLFVVTDVPSPFVQSGLIGNIIRSGPDTLCAVVSWDQSSVQFCGVM
jgi:hypothetical protein